MGICRNLGRTPPLEVRRHLRKEVNFGCPVDGCGMPYLTWHHFDPPWSEKEHHDPDGMTALCANHAALADGGAWTKGQIRQMKQNPFVRADQVLEQFRFLRSDVLCQIGSLAYGFGDFITISNDIVLGLTRTLEGYLGVNITLRDLAGNVILRMIENDWILYLGDVFDFECPTRGQSFRVHAKDGVTDFSVKFDDLSINQFKEEHQDYDSEKLTLLLRYMNQPSEIHLLKILGTIQTSSLRINLSDTQILAKGERMHFQLRKHIFIGHSGVSLFAFNKDGTITMGGKPAPSDKV